MLLDYDNPIIILLRKVLSCLLLGFLWIICCLLILPGGIGSTAIYYAIEKHILREEDYTLSCFFHSFQESIWAASIAWFLFLFLGAFLIWDFFFLLPLLRAGLWQGFLCFPIGLLLVLLVLTAVYTFSYIARFRDTVKGSLKNGFLLMLSSPKMNLKLIGIFAVFIIGALMNPIIAVLYAGIAWWLIVIGMEKVFRNIQDTQKD